MPIDWLIFAGGLLIVTTEKGNAVEISYSDARSLVTVFLGFHIVTTGNLINNRGLRPSYKSDSLVRVSMLFLLLNTVCITIIARQSWE
jgi:hypothetical protein